MSQSSIGYMNPDHAPLWALVEKERANVARLEAENARLRAALKEAREAMRERRDAIDWGSYALMNHKAVTTYMNAEDAAIDAILAEGKE